MGVTGGSGCARGVQAAPEIEEEDKEDDVCQNVLNFDGVFVWKYLKMEFRSLLTTPGSLVLVVVMIRETYKTERAQHYGTPTLKVCMLFCKCVGVRVHMLPAPAPCRPFLRTLISGYFPWPQKVPLKSSMATVQTKAPPKPLFFSQSVCRHEGRVV